MFCKLFIVAACAATVLAQAARYPADVRPDLCPNYPICDHGVDLTRGAVRVPQIPSVPVVPEHHRTESVPETVVPGARGWPAGVAPAACPNYPFCNTGANVPAGYVVREWPAGVAPAACPSYPYC